MPIVAASFTMVHAEDLTLKDLIEQAQLQAVEQALRDGVTVHDPELLRRKLVARDTVRAAYERLTSC